MNFASFVASIPAPLKTRGAALAAVAALQIGALAYIVADRVRLVTTGREIVLPIIPVDPRDLFKGDYVRLGFPISTVPLDAAARDAMPLAKHAFVVIEQQPDDSWKAMRLLAAYPSGLPANQVVLRVRPAQQFSQRQGAMQVRYGIERYYVPEGKGGNLEKLAREKKLAAIVAVDARGNAAIKGLSTDGKKVYDEPLF